MHFNIYWLLNINLTQNLVIGKMTNNYDYLFKYIIIGDSSVGKSCILLRFTEGRFKTDHQPTLGVEFGSKNIDLAQYTIKTQIWDTAGQQSFKAITRSYYKGSIAAFLVFDITKRISFENLNKWLFEVKNHSHEKVEIVLIGNKSDLHSSREISHEEADKFASENGFQYYEVSASTGDKIEEAFKKMTEAILKKIINKEINPESESSFGIRKGKKQKKEISSPTRSGPTTIKSSNFQPEIEKRKTCCK